MLWGISNQTAGSYSVHLKICEFREWECVKYLRNILIIAADIWLYPWNWYCCSGKLEIRYVNSVKQTEGNLKIQKREEEHKRWSQYFM